jgi:hypothetical protein
VLPLFAFYVCRLFFSSSSSSAPFRQASFCVSVDVALGGLCMPHGRFIWAYGHYTTPNCIYGRLLASLISRVIVPFSRIRTRTLFSVRAVLFLPFLLFFFAEAAAGAALVLFYVSVLCCCFMSQCYVHVCVYVFIIYKKNITYNRTFFFLSELGARHNHNQPQLESGADTQRTAEHCRISNIAHCAL